MGLTVYTQPGPFYIGTVTGNEQAVMTPQPRVYVSLVMIMQTCLQFTRKVTPKVVCSLQTSMETSRH